MFYIIRILIILVFSLSTIIYFAIWKNKTKNVKIVIIVLFILNAFLSLIYIVPFENLFYSFETVDELIKYTKGDVSVVEFVDGKESSVVVYQQDDDLFSIFMIKSNDGYKISTVITEKTVVRTNSQGCFISIINVKGSNDYYLEIQGFFDEEINFNVKIEDNIQTDFKVITNSENNSKYFYCIEKIDFNDIYQLFINGEKVILE